MPSENCGCGKYCQAEIFLSHLIFLLIEIVTAARSLFSRLLKILKLFTYSIIPEFRFMTMVFSLQLVVNVWQGNYKLFKKNVRIKLYDESDRSVRFVVPIL